MGTRIVNVGKCDADYWQVTLKESRPSRRLLSPDHRSRLEGRRSYARSMTITFAHISLLGPEKALWTGSFFWYCSWASMVAKWKEIP